MNSGLISTPLPVLGEIKISPRYRAGAASGQNDGEILTVDGDFHSPGVRRSNIVLGATFVISCRVPSYSGYVQVFSALELPGWERKARETDVLANDREAFHDESTCADMTRFWPTLGEE